MSLQAKLFGWPLTFPHPYLFLTDLRGVQFCWFYWVYVKSAIVYLALDWTNIEVLFWNEWGHLFDASNQLDAWPNLRYYDPTLAVKQYGQLTKLFGSWATPVLPWDVWGIERGREWVSGGRFQRVGGHLHANWRALYSELIIPVQRVRWWDAGKRDGMRWDGA